MKSFWKIMGMLELSFIDVYYLAFVEICLDIINNSLQNRNERGEKGWLKSNKILQNLFKNMLMWETVVGSWVARPGHSHSRKANLQWDGDTKKASEKAGNATGYH